MAESRRCSFCGSDIGPGTGMTYVRKNGQVLNFCKSKCRKNMVELRRNPAKVEWTQKARTGR